ncbi:uncharacterized protein BX663DRAFT_496718 [Cokeromyces recurvatus]|uniref:uncharacterized protein n=1 Tax=Cokeromyces recurvatus TaxID=90255 RepID=UPI0022201BB8|nr:uncharacterized protein BX663DRAFT_496718 [Cokeromyces recurvatus]KAI7906501.1 hypothetical protein BX663DRAFT_496718 [Cokeromyces recurvatus]
MKNSIRSLFGLKKKSKKSNSNKSTASNKTYSTNSSVSSLSSYSSTNDSLPQTPTSPSMQNARGIFRTLEPVWYCRSNLIPKNQSDNNNNEWIQFDEHSQFILEASFHSNTQCALTDSIVGTCTVLFKPLPSNKNLSQLQNKRHTVMALPKHQYNSAPILSNNNNLGDNAGRTLELNKHIRRTISPVWWFEQDQADGTKGMCRFDYKNQVRLEALSEGRTRMVLTDNAFNVPFTVALEPPKQRELKEEVRGFLYLEPISTAFQLAYDATQSNHKMENFELEDPVYDNEEQWINNYNRRFSI